MLVVEALEGEEQVATVSVGCKSTRLCDRLRGLEKMLQVIRAHPQLIT